MALDPAASAALRSLRERQPFELFARCTKSEAVLSRDAHVTGISVQF